jgi:transcription elongation factor S-II
VRRFILLPLDPLQLPTDDHAAASDLILQRARTVEETVCKDFKGTTATYKSKIRMLFVNLKDKNNPGLRRSVTAGDIPAQTFARMASQVCLSPGDNL